MAEEFCGKCYNAAGRLEARIAELEAALRGLLSACERYDEDPESNINQGNYLDAKIEANVFLTKSAAA